MGGEEAVCLSLGDRGPRARVRGDFGGGEGGWGGERGRRCGKEGEGEEKEKKIEHEL